MDRSNRLGTERIPKLLVQFSLPAIVGMMAQALYNIVDRVFVGQALGSQGIAGIAVCFPYMLVLLACGMFVGFGAAALVSMRLGAADKAGAERVLSNAVVLLVLVSALLTVLGIAALDPLLRLFGTTPTIHPFAREYLEIIVLATVFQVAGFGLNAIIRGEGNPRIAMLTLLIGVVLNVVLAPTFIFGFGWGIRGAAWATAISQAVSALWVLAYFLSGNSVLRLRLQPSLDAATVRQILVIGSPFFAMQMAASVMNSLLNNQLRIHGGDLAISVMGVVYSVAMLVSMPIFGINQGVQPIIGFNYGAGKHDRVKQALQAAIQAASAIALVGFLIAMLFPGPVVRLFSHHDQEMVQLGSHAMRISLLMLPLIGFQVVSASYFQAVGKSRQAMLLMLSRQVLLLIPAVLILPKYFGLDGIWAAIPAADACSSLLTAACLFTELRHLQGD